MSKESPDDATIELRRMRVTRRARGTGIAQKLLDKAEEFAWSRGETRIVLLTTYAQVAAIKLYKRNGYEVTKITPGRRPTIGFLPGILWRFVYMHKDRPTFSN
ncbi:putative N-acetyltransferase 14 [Convolutriloba macropyga]|uniref:putative N-acetyltransferase 14 n=1 Tax=Convolutriloba macropyga TaxID=536237 RepID=UPI003F51FDBB